MQIIGSLYNVIEEWEPEDLVFSTDYWNIIEQGKEDDDATERAFRKKYHTCFLV